MAIFVLPPSWGVAVLVGVLIWEVAEKLFWLRLINRYPIAVGSEALIGLPVTATTDCLPGGRVKLFGESWQARCSVGARFGETLVVEDVEQLTLVVGKAYPDEPSLAAL